MTRRQQHQRQQQPPPSQALSPAGAAIDPPAHSQQQPDQQQQQATTSQHASVADGSSVSGSDVGMELGDPAAGPMRQAPPPAPTAAGRAIFDAAEAGNARQLRNLLQGAANPQALLTQLHGGFTALHAAMLRGQVHCMEILLAAGSVDPQLLAGSVPEGCTALMLAILTAKSTAAVELLLRQPCVREQLEATDATRTTAFMYACNGGHTAYAKLLLNAGYAATQVQASDM